MAARAKRAAGSNPKTKAKAAPAGPKGATTAARAKARAKPAKGGRRAGAGTRAKVVSKKAGGAKDAATATAAAAAPGKDAAAATDEAKGEPARPDPDAAAEPPEPVPEPIAGKVTLRYSHYNEEVDIVCPKGPGTGAVKAADIIELFALDYAFHGDFVVHVRGPGEDGPRLEHHDDATDSKEGGGRVIRGLDVDKEYFVEVEEDAVAEAKVEHKAFTAASDTGLVSTSGAAMGEDSSSCSCLYGNPCMEPYNCKDWHNRFDVAKKNGWKGFN